jgi:hypothetical protein
MGGWMSSVADLLDPLYEAGKRVLFECKVIGTGDTGVKVLDRKLPFARTGRIWPYVGDDPHPVVIYDYTPTRGRDGPSKFLEGYQGYLQADAYSLYDAFFKPTRGLIEVGCWMPARRYFTKAMDSDSQRMGPALYLIARRVPVRVWRFRSFSTTPYNSCPDRTHRIGSSQSRNGSAWKMAACTAVAGT